MDITLTDVAKVLEPMAGTVERTTLGGNVAGLVVTLPGMPADQCVLVTVDDGQESGPAGVGEWECAPNYVAGTDLPEMDGARRFTAVTAGEVADKVLWHARVVRDARYSL